MKRPTIISLFIPVLLFIGSGTLSAQESAPTDLSQSANVVEKIVRYNDYLQGAKNIYTGAKDASSVAGKIIAATTAAAANEGTASGATLTFDIAANTNFLQNIINGIMQLDNAEHQRKAIEAQTDTWQKVYSSMDLISKAPEVRRLASSLNGYVSEYNRWQGLIRAGQQNGSISAADAARYLKRLQSSSNMVSNDLKYLLDAVFKNNNGLTINEKLEKAKATSDATAAEAASLAMQRESVAGKYATKELENSLASVPGGMFGGKDESDVQWEKKAQLSVKAAEKEYAAEKSAVKSSTVKSLKQAYKPLYQLIQYIIIIITGIYLVVNYWKLSKHEFQNRDALIKVFVGFFIGMLALGIMALIFNGIVVTN